MAGSREKAWGKDKHFREGQAKQVLSDLFFAFLHPNDSGYEIIGRDFARAITAPRLRDQCGSE